jgi:pilus assembly protein Flp/PilA
MVKAQSIRIRQPDPTKGEGPIMNSIVSSTRQCLETLRFWVRANIESERGATAVEYGLLVALIAVVIISAVLLLGGDLSGIFGKTGTAIETAA